MIRSLNRKLLKPYDAPQHFNLLSKHLAPILLSLLYLIDAPSNAIVDSKAKANLLGAFFAKKSVIDVNGRVSLTLNNPSIQQSTLGVAFSSTDSWSSEHAVLSRIFFWFFNRYMEIGQHPTGSCQRRGISRIQLINCLNISCCQGHGKTDESFTNFIFKFRIQKWIIY